MYKSQYSTPGMLHNNKYLAIGASKLVIKRNYFSGLVGLKRCKLKKSSGSGTSPGMPRKIPDSTSEAKIILSFAK